MMKLLYIGMIALSLFPKGFLKEMEILNTSTTPNPLSDEQKQGYYYYEYSGNEKYIIDTDQDQINLCVKKDTVLHATYYAKLLSLPSLGVHPDDLMQWTIVPSHRGSSIAIAKKDFEVSEEVFTGGCADIHIFQSFFNISEKVWCQEKRILPCFPIWQIQYHVLGFTPITEPGKAINVVYQSFTDSYSYFGADEYFSLYYYECGGIRTGGTISSPRFPEDFDASRNIIRCKWDLAISSEVDYVIVKFSKFDLPDCSRQNLTILEDTLLNVEDVTEELLKIIHDGSVLPNDTVTHKPTDGISSRTKRNVNRDQHDPAIREYIEVYRDWTIPMEMLSKDPRLGIHVVDRKVYCGNYRPKRNTAWRQGAKNVSMILESANSSLWNHGFIVKLSPISFRSSNNVKNQLNRNKRLRKDISSKIIHYIILIVFVPVGCTIGLSIIVFHIKRSSPSLKDFYKKEKREGRNFDLKKKYFPGFSAPPRLLRARHTTQQNSSQPKSIENVTSSALPKKRKHSAKVRVKQWKWKRPSFRLKTVYEENSSQSKNDSVTFV